jgi:hypothetical protein
MTRKAICTKFHEDLLISAWRLHLQIFVNIATIISRFITNATEVQTSYLCVNCLAVYRQLLNSEQIVGNVCTCSVRPWNKVDGCQEIGVRLCAGGWGTALQAGMAWVWFPMLSVRSFVYLIFPDAQWPWGRLSFWKKWVQVVSSAGKVGRCVGLTTLPHSCPNRLEILGASNSWKHKGSRGCHEMKDVYPFVNICDESRDKHPQLRLKKRLNCKISTKENVILWWRLSCVNLQLLLVKCFSSRTTLIVDIKETGRCMSTL